MASVGKKEVDELLALGESERGLECLCVGLCVGREVFSTVHDPSP